MSEDMWDQLEKEKNLKIEEKKEYISNRFMKWSYGEIDLMDIESITYEVKSGYNNIILFGRKDYKRYYNTKTKKRQDNFNIYFNYLLDRWRNIKIT